MARPTGWCRNCFGPWAPRWLPSAARPAGATSISTAARSELGVKIALDCGNGAAYRLAPELFRTLGAEVVAIGCSPDGRNINLHCGALHLEALQEAVVAHGAAFGAAFDGDADRAIFVSAAGKVVNGDAVLLA